MSSIFDKIEQSPPSGPEPRGPEQCPSCDERTSGWSATGQCYTCVAQEYAAIEDAALRCRSLERSASSDPCTNPVSPDETMCWPCREHKQMCDDHDAMLAPDGRRYRDSVSLAASFLAGGESMPVHASTTVKIAHALLAADAELLRDQGDRAFNTQMRRIQDELVECECSDGRMLQPHASYCPARCV